MQDLLAILIVVIAAGFLMRRAWITFAAQRAGRTCGSCGNCGAGDTSKSQSLVTLDELTFSADRPSSRQP